MDENLDLLFHFFPELKRDGLKLTHKKQWDKFLIAFCYICIWIHHSRSVHKNGNGIVLFPKWWNTYLQRSDRWFFNVIDELKPYITTSGKYDSVKGVCREWIVNPEFKELTKELISHPLFKLDDKWKFIVKSVIITDEPKIKKGTIQLSTTPSFIANHESFLIINAFADSLKKGLPIEYTESATGRLHHPLQNIKKIDRNNLFNNWYSYDFKACAPSILLQEFNKLCPNTNLPNIELFIENREEIRNTIAASTGISKGLIKKALTGLFFGQKIPSESQIRWDISSTKDENFKFSLLNSFGEIVTQKLIQNDMFMNIVKDCQLKITKALSKSLRQQVIIENDKKYLINMAGGKKEMQRWNSRQAVAHWYFGLERQVLNIAYEELVKNDCQFLLIHDGFICNKKIDTTVITTKIKTELDISLELIEEYITHI